MSKLQSAYVRRSQRMIRMVGDLHRMGYQHLRTMPYLHPNAWRLAIAHASHFSTTNPASLRGTEDFASAAIYTAAGGNKYFDWSDATTSNSRQLADMFVDRFPTIASRGLGRDWQYAGWLAELVGVLEGGDLLPVVEWEQMRVRPEEQRFIPLWEHGSETNVVWTHDFKTEPHPDVQKFDLPPPFTSQ